MTWDIKINNVSRPEASLKHISDELNDHLEAVVVLPNTSAFRSLIATDQDVEILWNSASIFKGRLTGAKYSQDQLDCYCYHTAYERMNKKDISNEYSSTSAATILADICSAAGVVAGSCPTTLIGVKFVRANCWEAAKWLARACNADFWLDFSGADPRFNIGAKGSDKGTLTSIGISDRGKDRAKKFDKVYVKGEDAEGNIIWGEAGTGTNVRTFIDRKSRDVATLNNIAAKKLEEINTETCAIKITDTINDAYNIFSGDTVTITSTELELSGARKVWKITKGSVEVSLELDRITDTTDRKMQQTRELEDLGIYPLSTFSPRSSPQDNMLLNASFEVDRDGNGVPDFWDLSEGGSSLETSDSYEGKQCVKISATTLQNLNVYSVRIPVQPGHTYMLRARAKANVTSVGNVLIGAVSYDRNQQGVHWNYTLHTIDNTWDNEIMHIQKAASDTFYLSFRIGLRYPTVDATVYFDACWMFKQISWVEMFDEGNAIATFSKRFDDPTFQNVDPAVTEVSDATAYKGTCKKLPNTNDILEPFDSPLLTDFKLSGEFYGLFALKVDTNLPTGNLVTLRIVASAQVRVSVTIKASDFGAANQWQVFAIRGRIEANDTGVYLDLYDFKGLTNGVTLWCDWIGIVSADVPLALTGVTVLDSSTGISNPDELTNINPDLMATGISNPDELTNINPDLMSTGISNPNTSISWSNLGDSGLGTEHEVGPGTSSVLLQQLTVTPPSGSQPLVAVTIYWERGASGGYADVQFRILEVTNLRHTFHEPVSAESPDGRQIIFMHFLYPSGTVLNLYARTTWGGQYVYVRGAIRVDQSPSHTHVPVDPTHDTTYVDPKHTHVPNDPTHDTTYVDPKHTHVPVDPQHTHSPNDPEHEH